MNLKKRPVAAVALISVAVAAVTGSVLFTAANRDSGETTQADVDEIQREMRAQTPKGLEQIPPEIAQKGVRMMGGKE
ncbi:MAG: hypothetical protein ACO1SV_19050 [Fimbriimonas sp.]